jgi:signal transduction histidine kinase
LLGSSLQNLQSQNLINHENSSQTLLLSKSILEENNPIFLSDSSIWEFRSKSYESWSDMDADSFGYIDINPSSLKLKDVEDSTIIEGWFRTRILVDSSLSNSPLHLTYYDWHPVDFYIDGKLVHSFGSTGGLGKPFRENKPIHSGSFDFYLTPGNIHILDFYYVGHFPVLPFESFDRYLKFDLINLETKNYLDEHIEEEPFYNTTRIVVGALLTLLFWFLTLLNPKEKSFLIIAAFSTYIFILSWILSQLHNPDSTYELHSILDTLMMLLGTFFDVVIILTTASLTGRKITRGILSLLSAIFVIRILFVIGIIDQKMAPLVVIFTLLVVVYIGLSSFKLMKKSQRSIVFGLFLFIISMLLYVIYFNIYPYDNFRTKSLLSTSIFLSFPLSLLVFVAFRYKEIINEVEINAKKLIRIEEEKKQILATQNERLDKEVKERTAELNLSLKNLESTQAQLIQSEKMASLGELTAGIAHEIQNPLNFVNNFSEVSKELIQEMREEINSGDIVEAKIISKEIEENLEKINHHGKRADSIVKGMLLHSRTSKGEKVPTDINALCDEFLRLSYHGLRAKDRTFNAEFEMDFDESLPKIEVVPQDIGRVLLNLFNNAFCAASDEALRVRHNLSEGEAKSDSDSKAKSSKPLTELEEGVDSMESLSTHEENNISRTALSGVVKVHTKNLGDKIEITVTDNGPGIPDDIKDKIFQPFFTTKPTGQGTGLGLSLAYDIVKAHGGEINVDSPRDSGTNFKILLPIE